LLKPPEGIGALAAFVDRLAKEPPQRLMEGDGPIQRGIGTLLMRADGD
jgi:hypothetical protein